MLESLLKRIRKKGAITYSSLPPNTKLYLSDEPYFIHKTREQGEQDIADLVESAEGEGAWVFAADRQIWYNVRSSVPNGQGDKDETKWSVKPQPVDYGQFGQVLSFYHIHPQGIGDGLYNLGVSKAKKNPNLTEDVAEAISKNLSAIGVSIPSESDVLSAVNLLGLSNAAEFNFKIVSPYGILTMEITSDVPKGFSNDYAMDLRNNYSSKLKQIIDNGLRDIFVREKDPGLAIFHTIDSINSAMEGQMRLTMHYWPPE